MKPDASTWSFAQCAPGCIDQDAGDPRDPRPVVMPEIREIRVPLYAGDPRDPRPVVMLKIRAIRVPSCCR
jgi:hypothetical protein